VRVALTQDGAKTRGCVTRSERFTTRETRAAQSVSTISEKSQRAWHEICK
jgi:hypothetical protein